MLFFENIQEDLKEMADDFNALNKNKESNFHRIDD
jgi:hypothetical protein